MKKPEDDKLLTVVNWALAAAIIYGLFETITK